MIAPRQPLGDRVLDWLVRRLKPGAPVASDLILVTDHRSLTDAGAAAVIGGEAFRIARVTGEITLRDALPETDRLIAIVPPGFTPPLDIAGRAYLGRVLEIRGEDLVAAMARKTCETLDEAIAQAVMDAFDLLEGRIAEWSLGEQVTRKNVRDALIAVELGTTGRLERERDHTLLARWIEGGTPKFRVPSLVAEALRDAHPRSGRWLSWAITAGSVEKLCVAGALLGSSDGEREAPSIPDLDRAELVSLCSLVETAVREAWRRASSRVEVVLAEAEAVGRRTSLDPVNHPLLRSALESALPAMAHRCAAGEPPDHAHIEALRSSLHAADFEVSIELIGHLARLARFLRTAALPPTDAPAERWSEFALSDAAWVDWTIREARRRIERVPGWLGDPARRVLSAVLARRDAMNDAFARALARDWPQLAASKDLRRPLPLQHVSRSLLRRLVSDGKRVFLVVLDGCDLSCFLEILSNMDQREGIGLALPAVQDAALRDDLQAARGGALRTAIAPLPTVTSHARRALFAGEVAGNTVLDDTESAPANATADQIAFQKNVSLSEIPRRLFLKGDLGHDGQALLDVLRQGGERVVAVVYNAVDDALSSKETTPLPDWSLPSLGTGAAESIRVAIDRGWTVVVTADHGHTPFLHPDRKAPAAGGGHRFANEPWPGAVEFADGPLPRRPLFLLTRMGAWQGNQRRGFHGGAALEEVVVPLAFLGRLDAGTPALGGHPTWWWSSDVPAQTPAQLILEIERERPRVSSRPAATGALPAEFAAIESDLTADERAVLLLLIANGSARLTEMATHLKRSPVRVSGMLRQLVRKLRDVDLSCITTEALPDGDSSYRYQPVPGARRL